MKEALKLALEALESATPKYARQRKDQKELGGYLEYWKLSQYQRGDAIHAIKEALAQSEQEPVQWCSLCGRDMPPQRTWVRLTDEDIDEWTPEIHAVIRAIEAKLKEKNGV